MLWRYLSLLAVVLPLAVTAPAAPEGEQAWTTALKGHVHAGRVDYSGMKVDPAFQQALSLFESTDPGSLQGHERLAFWINAYNAFTVKLICEHYPVKSIRDISAKPWDDPFIVIHGEKYSLNKIEHEMIRAKYHEPRVHFALVCAAKGCPPLRAEAYTGAKLEKQLDDQTRKFLGDTTKNRYDATIGTLRISHIFEWYAKDFSDAAGSVTSFIARYLPGAITSSTPIVYNEYDWSLNGR